MTLARLPLPLLWALAAVALAAALLSGPGVRLPLLAVAAGAAAVAALRPRTEARPRPRVELLSRVALSPRATAALLSVDGAGWLVVLGDGCAQLARAELAPPPGREVRP